MRGRGAGGARHAEQLKSSQDLRLLEAGTSATADPNLIDRANPRPDPAGKPQRLRGKLPRRIAPWGPFQQPFPVHHPGSRIQIITTPSIPSSDWCHRCHHDSFSDPGSRGNQGGAGAGWPLEARLPCALQKGEPASYLFPTPVAASLPGPTAFPLPPQTAGSASPTSATPRLGGAHPSYLTAVAGASECSYWGRGEREAGTGGKLAPLIGQRRRHSQLEGFCGLTLLASEPTSEESL